jgi:NAD(P)-dependent dehydrogenase (short-subunit alcohol dehydrogenase family)
MMMIELEGKVAVVTGAGRGLGRGIAERCAREGMHVVVADILPAPLAETDAALRAMGARTLAVETDVSQRNDIQRLADQAYDTFGQVDLLINNAGVAVESAPLDTTSEDWQWVMGVNFFGTLYGVQTFLPRMIAQNTPAHVVNVASLAGAIEAIDAYHVSKHAAVALSEAIYHDLADRAPQIGVTVFMPGLVDTELYRSGEARPERFTQQTPKPEADKDYSDWEAMFRNHGVPVGAAVTMLFEAIKQNRLYAGPIGFEEQGPGISEAIRRRADNIASERNPDHPRKLDPSDSA